MLQILLTFSCSCAKGNTRPPVVEQVVGYMRTLVCIVEANPPPKTDLEIDNPQLRFVKDGQTVIQDERYLL